MSHLSALKLHNFRSYKQAALKDLQKGLIVLYGKNGAGKTNILEALSLLSPGRGIRTAKSADIQNTNEPAPWAVAGTMQTDTYGSINLGTGRDPVTDKRTIRIDGETLRAQSALGEYCQCIWLTPQMDRLFMDSSRERRRFLDRMVYNFDPGHAGRLTRYENVLRQRSKLLQEEKTNDSWLAALESQMAETGIAISIARRDFIEKLNRFVKTMPDTGFPKSRLTYDGFTPLENLDKGGSALDVEDTFKNTLKSLRSIDATRGGCLEGPHRSDLLVTFEDTGRPADQCSTGEQKALLIGLILAQTLMVKAEKNTPPILLLDEIAAHLDEARRASLYDLLSEIGCQTWLTGTEKELFEEIRDTAQFFEIENSKIK